MCGGVLALGFLNDRLLALVPVRRDGAGKGGYGLGVGFNFGIL